MAAEPSPAVLNVRPLSVFSVSVPPMAVDGRASTVALAACRHPRSAIGSAEAANTTAVFSVVTTSAVGAVIGRPVVDRSDGERHGARIGLRAAAGVTQVVDPDLQRVGAGIVLGRRVGQPGQRRVDGGHQAGNRQGARVAPVMVTEPLGALSVP